MNCSNKSPKRALPFLLAFTLITFPLSACSEQSSSGTPDQGSSQPAKVAAQKVGDTISTDLVEVTPTSIQFAFALNNQTPFGADAVAENNHFLQPKEYNPDEDSKNPFVASKGNVLVSFEIKANNLDRKSLTLDDSSTSSQLISAVEYNGVTYSGSDVTAKGYCSVPEKGSSGSRVANLLLGNEGPEIHRGYVEFHFEPSSTSDSMKVTFSLPNSDGSRSEFVFQT